MAAGPAGGATADCAAGRATLDPLAAEREVARTIDLLVSSHACGPPLRSRNCPEPPIPPPHVNFIDDEIFDKLQADGIVPAALAGDEEFFRRVTLDLTGRIPSSEEVSAFRLDADANKRSNWIEHLLASDGFVDRWTFFYDELLRNVSYSENSYIQFGGRNAYHRFFEEAVRTGKPHDQVVKELIAGHGNSFENGPANFTARELVFNGPMQDTFDNLAATSGQAFLGTNLFCTSCHNGAGHLESINLWLASRKRKEFWGMSAFYAGTSVRFIQAGIEYPIVVTAPASGVYELDTTDGNKTPRLGFEPGLVSVTPSFILTGEPPRSNETYRAALGRMVTSHPQFSRAAANYVWKELFTLGIVEPADGFDLLRQDPNSPPPEPWKVQPTHPKLLDRLGAEFAVTGFDLRSLVRTIVSSSAYQLSSTYPDSYDWSDTFIPDFPRHFPRRLRAEEVYDAVSMATGVAPKLPVYGFSEAVSWAGQLPDGMEPFTFQPLTGLRATVLSFLDAFGRGNRDARKRSNEGSILRSLTLMNDPVVTDRVRVDTVGSLTSRIAAANLSAADAVKLLFLSTLSRPPTDRELTESIAFVEKAGAASPRGLEDLQYALLNKLDFLFNY